ncbi:PTS sugar transporter subunit IIB [Melissococcus plutonius]|uniref:PTS system, IIB component n=1 Tax=Melissococcus plutonius (strain ATCC 35311 / DSM 29964 / CIP 104052 / LMG 20360 / NCIMB 702443) TaxID=940190 RepID=F3Y7N9_MELPT|nr:PTS sugar transporter subunit IIB [Melissococcus plutonius]KMT30529.1 PTS system mannose-specific EIIAB component ManX [Melissococcus plutonius]KMT35774.1 PTS system mannose-specific EIIAB component ManX [Melissococcus plutonius]KMT40893.1 PTS system mannose-specific EIIAB component ManX [Melissococcus plutonius]MBB5177683.1 PTS system mannose-specific IIB component [Melissococcus plutonius]BAK20517.1 PTS system, IIB component [Melissococcus plutonius ATCC 35311]
MGMDIRLVRIDDRLLHGQVATVWTKATKINRILIVSDKVAEDILRKNLLIQAAPPEVLVNILPIQKMIDIYLDERFDHFKAMLLFTNPTDVVRIIKGGIKITEINVGGMSFQIGKQMITNAIAVDQTDIAAFNYLHNQGIQLEIRKVVTDSRLDMMNLLKKENLVKDLQIN